MKVLNISVMNVNFKHQTKAVSEDTKEINTKVCGIIVNSVLFMALPRGVSKCTKKPCMRGSDISVTSVNLKHRKFIISVYTNRENISNKVSFINLVASSMTL